MSVTVVSLDGLIIMDTFFPSALSSFIKSKVVFEMFLCVSSSWKVILWILYTSPVSGLRHIVTASVELVCGGIICNQCFLSFRLAFCLLGDFQKC